MKNRESIIDFIKKDLFSENIFTKIYVLAIICSLIYSIVYSFFVDDNVYFLIGNMNSDPGSDLYQSICYSSKLEPYSISIFPYPPLSVLFCYILMFFSHENFKNLTIGIDYETAFKTVFSNIFVFKNINLIFSIISINLLVLILINYIIRMKSIRLNYAYIISFCLIANIGLLCGLVRGNLLIGALLFSTFFVLFYNDENLIIKEISLISLAIAFNIKPYVAIFGFLLLPNKKYKEALRTSVYALLMFIMPFFLLHGGFQNNIKMFFESMLSFGGNSYSVIGFKSFFNLMIKFINKVFRINLEFDRGTTLITIFLSVTMLIFSQFKMKEWQRVLILTLIMLMASMNFGYVLAFLLIPMICFLCEEDRFNAINCIYFTILLILMLPLRGIRMHIIFDNIILVLLSIFIIFHILFIKKELQGE